MPLDTSLLRDIYVPDFSLAWGWWMLIALFIFILAIVASYILKRWYKNAYRRLALRALSKCKIEMTTSSSKYINHINEVLKFTAIQAYPNASVAGLTGIAWLNFLDKNWKSKNVSGFTATTNELLLGAQYTKKYLANHDDLAHLYNLSCQWIKQHKC